MAEDESAKNGPYGRSIPCAVPHCSGRARADELMCIEHWPMLPDNLRNDLLQAWRKGDVGRYQRALHDALNLVG